MGLFSCVTYVALYYVSKPQNALNNFTKKKLIFFLQIVMIFNYNIMYSYYYFLTASTVECAFMYLSNNKIFFCQQFSVNSYNNLCNIYDNDDV